MRNEASGVAAKIRALAWTAPVIVAWQPSCVVGSSNCDGVEPTRNEARAPWPGDVDGGSVGDPLASEAACTEFCNRVTSSVGGQAPFECGGATEDGGTVIVCSWQVFCEGRHPAGYVAPEADAHAPLLARYFAKMAAGEAASVVAFERMALELDVLGMPAELSSGARRAAREEARHFRMTAALTRRFGAQAPRANIPVRPPRTLLDLAIENAEEGVVRETFGAVAGFWQAQHATERSVRHVMRRIAIDETSHAELSWAVDEAARERLSAPERRALDAATARAIRRAERELDANVAPELVARAGLPDRSTTRALFENARATLWS